MANLTKHLSFKIISLIVVFTFLYQQLLWAVDYEYGLPVNNDENRSGFLSAESLAQAQARQEEFITYLQSVESANSNQAQTTTAVTTDAGDVVHYSGDTLRYIERPDGSVLDAVTLTSANDLADAPVRYPDGPLLIIQHW